MKHIKGFTSSHWMPPSGECLRRIALAADIVATLVENTGRLKPKVMRILGGRGHLSICVFVLYLYQKIPLKIEYQMKIHKTASEQLFSGSSTLFFCIWVNLRKFPTKSQPNIQPANSHRDLYRIPSETQEKTSAYSLHLNCNYLVHLLFYLTQKIGQEQICMCIWFLDVWSNKITRE